MNIHYVCGEYIAETLIRLMQEYKKFYWAIAWGSDNPASEYLIQYKEKISFLVIGTHFYQTSPEFLEKFVGLESARVIAPNGATFHPKIYLFESGNRSSILIGSANFTNSAMSGNIETCCLIEGASDEKIFEDVRKFISSECWEQASVIDADFLRSYRIQHAATKMARASLENFTRLRRPRATSSGIDPIEMSWDEFVKKVRSEEHLKKRLEVLGRARFILNKVSSFSKLSAEERKAIAGTLGEKERQLTGLDWGLFGSMFGFGILKKKINENSKQISDAINCIPPTGIITQDNYNEFISHYRNAFKDEARIGGIASASRLLAMKRPDCFVCIDKQNKAGLSAHFGLPASAINIDNYWQELIEPIWSSPWCNSARPSGINGQIWDGRSALLDAIFYDPS